MSGRGGGRKNKIWAGGVAGERTRYGRTGWRAKEQDMGGRGGGRKNKIWAGGHVVLRHAPILRMEANDLLLAADVGQHALGEGGVAERQTRVRWSSDARGNAKCS